MESLKRRHNGVTHRCGSRNRWAKYGDAIPSVRALGVYVHGCNVRGLTRIDGVGRGWKTGVCSSIQGRTRVPRWGPKRGTTVARRRRRCHASLRNASLMSAVIADPDRGDEGLSRRYLRVRPAGLVAPGR